MSKKSIPFRTCVLENVQIYTTCERKGPNICKILKKMSEYL